jgi:hypothetical protein
VTFHPEWPIGSQYATPTDLAGKANVSHGHAQSDVTGLSDALAGKANATHSHAQSDVTGLADALSGKQETLVSGTNIKTVNGGSLLGSGDLVVSASAAWGGITGTLSSQTDLQTALDAKMPNGAFRIIASAETKANDNSVQNWFASPSGVALDADSLYEFQGELRITKGNSLAVTTSVLVAAISGGALEISGVGCNIAANQGNATSRVFYDTRLATAIQATASSSVTGLLITVQGVIRTTTAGQTFTPQFSFSGAPGATVQCLPGTRMRIRKIGANTFTNSGWA